MTINYLDSKRISALGSTDKVTIALDTRASESNTGTQGTTMTLDVTIGTGSKRALFVCLNTDPNVTVSHIKLDGVAFTEISGTVRTDVGKNSIWQLINPASGTGTITVTWGASAGYVGMSAISFTGVDQTTPVNTSNITSSYVSTGGSGVQTVSITPANTGSAIFGYVVTQRNVLTSTGSGSIASTFLPKGETSSTLGGAGFSQYDLSPTIGSANNLVVYTHNTATTNQDRVIIEINAGTLADVKPTNVQDNSILVEKDTGRRYWFDLGVEPKGTSGSGGNWAEVSFNNSTIVNNESASGNVVTRTSGSGWNSYIRSNEYISPSTGGGEIYFTQSANTNISVGLEKSPFNPAPSATYTGKDYSFHTTSSSNNMYEHTSDYAGTAWASATNEYRITMDSAGLVKYYWRSGSSGAWTLERTSTVTASGDYYFTVSHSGTAGAITSYIKGTPATWTKQVSSTPPTVAGLTLHLDSSDASTITKDGSNLVSAWNDKSGQANHITQATGSKQPLWVDRVQDTLPIIRFDGTDDFLKIASWSGGALATSTSYMVFKPDVAGTQTWFDSAINRTTWHGGGGSVPFQLYSGTVLASSVYVADGETIYCQIVSNGASSIIRRDGITIATGNAGSQSFNGIYLGSGQNTGYSEVDVAELLVYEGTHSTSDRDAIEAYLAKKWGL